MLVSEQCRSRGIRVESQLDRLTVVVVEVVVVVVVVVVVAAAAVVVVVVAVVSRYLEIRIVDVNLHTRSGIYVNDNGGSAKGDIWGLVLGRDFQN
ncbi:hypothetical protein ElyMa_005360100 [Elysia marginata]|uniref:Uncharacterized protein n=1 Tax=Elysia marginata TaxID=1093978 RepID=A0AAV4EBU2_9GAST|nr:hypothetical protein ElyMa_005360100 [Elysia marginata]